MRHLLRLLVVIAVVTTVFTFTTVRPVAACSSTGGTVTLGSGLFTFTTLTINPGDSATLTVSGSVPFASGFIPGPGGGHVTTYSNTGSTPINTSAAIGSGGGTFTWSLSFASCSQAVTSFNPGDGRLNGQPGDRLVVYCNAHATPPNVDVWVIDNGGSGHELTKLPLSDLTSVVEGKFSKNLGASGVLFAGSDASGNAYAALQGGPYGGTAKSDWLKTFSCKAS